MIPESYQIPALIAAILALASFIIIPVIAMNERWETQESPIAMSDSKEGTSCAVPPALDIEDSGNSLSAGPLLLDREEEDKLKTATFALG